MANEEQRRTNEENEEFAKLGQERYEADQNPNKQDPEVRGDKSFEATGVGDRVSEEDQPAESEIVTASGAPNPRYPGLTADPAEISNGLNIPTEPATMPVRQHIHLDDGTVVEHGEEDRFDTTKVYDEAGNLVSQAEPGEEGTIRRNPTPQW